MAYAMNVIIIETAVFTRAIERLMSDEEYRKFQNYIVVNPAVGDLIPGSGGLRKV